MPTAAAAGVPDVPATSSTLGSAFLERPTGASEYYLLDNQQWLSSSENRPMTPFVGRWSELIQRHLLAGRTPL